MARTKSDDGDDIQVADSKALKMYFEKVIKKGVDPDVSMVPSEFALFYSESRELWKMMEENVMYHSFIRLFQSARRFKEINIGTDDNRIIISGKDLTVDQFIKMFKDRDYDLFTEIRRGFWKVWRTQIERPMVTAHYAQIRDSAMFAGYGVSAVANISTGRALRKEKSLTPNEAAQIVVFRYEMLGLERSGRIEEVVGPMGAGKSNYMCWKSIKLINKGHYVITNASIKGLTPEQERHVFRTNRLSEAYDRTIALRRRNFKGLIFWMLDEQGGSASGSAAEKTTTLEYTYMQDVLTTIRKQGVFIVRLRQTEKVPDAQKTWISIVTRKTTDHPESVTMEFIQNTKIEETMKFKTEDMKDYYDTNYKAIWVPDLNTKDLQTFMQAFMEKNKGNKDYRDIDALAEAVNMLMKKVKVGDQLNLMRVEQQTQQIQEAYDQMFGRTQEEKDEEERRAYAKQQEHEDEVYQKRVQQARKMREAREKKKPQYE